MPSPRSLAHLLPVLCLALAPLRSAGAAESESADLRYFRELVETRNYSLGQPVSPELTPDGQAVVFLRGGARDPVLRLYEFTIADQSLREILTPEKLLAGAEEKLTAEERSRRYDRHSALLEAVIARDPEQMQAALVHHLTTNEDEVRRHIQHVESLKRPE